jgi:hypothetical protein
MESKTMELPCLNDYSQSLSESVTEYAQGKLTTMVCMNCEVNFAPELDDVEAIDECEDIRTWHFASPYGGDIYIFMSGYQCSKEYLQRIMNMDKVMEMTTVIECQGLQSQQ